MDLLKEEKKLWREGKTTVVGLDEAGRGPLAGPVVAAAITVDKIKIDKEFKEIVKIIKDSKKLTPKKRESVFDKIIFHPAISYASSKVFPRMIEKINILEATKLAMKRAVKNLEKKIRKKIDFLIIDGNFKLEKSSISQKAVVRGDERIFSIMAASIIAKVKRDRMMLRYHQRFPQYRFDKHKGYGTRLHRKMIERYGACEIHRQTFKGVK